jgi:two-component system, NtrC family, response regulator HydG
MTGQTFGKRRDKPGAGSTTGSLPLHTPTERDVAEMPDISDLSARLRFSPQDGRIWLDDQRMLLIHLSALSGLRRELIDQLGLDRARGLLTRMGYASGARDAVLARKVRSNDSLMNAFLVGPQLHALEGIVSVEPVRVEADVATGHYYGEFLWRDSSEVDAHVAAYGMSSDPVCWMQIGYACGYTSVFMGRPILYREVECRATSSRHCRIIGKPVEEWDNAEADLVYLQPETFANQFGHPDREATAITEPNASALEIEMGLVGASSGFVSVCHLLKKVARTKATVLFLGETGVGKEMFARTLHRISERAAGPFIAVNCAAIPENLIEAELFGVERGAYTGAVQSRPGRFERAHGGTIFLDEIGTLNLTAQGKLLRALQESEIERVGGTATRKVDVRVVAATNVDLRAEMRKGNFREDLLFRLNIFPIRIPPLRERRDDVPLLMNHFLKKFTQRHGRRVIGFTERAVDHVLNYEFPGNIRELENIIERAVILAPEDGAIDVAHLFASSDEVDAPFFGVSRDGTLTEGRAAAADAPGGQSGVAGLLDELVAKGLPLETLEATLIDTAVRRAGGNLSQAARLLGMTRPQLAYRYRSLCDTRASATARKAKPGTIDNAGG